MQITKVKDKWRSKHKEKGSEKLTYQVILKQPKPLSNPSQQYPTIEKNPKLETAHIITRIKIPETD